MSKNIYDLLTNIERQPNFVFSPNDGHFDLKYFEKVFRSKLKEAGIKLFTTKDIQEKGTKNIMKQAIEIAKNNTDGIHISYDLDVIDPKIAPGVSVKANDGITEKEAFEILDEIIKNKELIKSFDLVEFNPDYDIDNKTEIIANKILENLINEIKKIND